MQVTAERYPAVMLTAVVAGLFSVLFCALLLVDFAKRSMNDPIDSAQLLAFRNQLRQQPNDAQLQQAARDLDLRLRQQYFRQRDFTRRGAYLLVAAAAIAVVTWRWAATLRRKLPKAPPGEPVDSQSRLSRIGLRATAITALLLVCATIGLSMTYHSPLPRSVADLAMAADSQETDSSNEGSERGDGARTDAQPFPSQPAPTEEALPTADEFQKNWPSFRGPRGARSGCHEPYQGRSWRRFGRRPPPRSPSYGDLDDHAGASGAAHRRRRPRSSRLDTTDGLVSTDGARCPPRNGHRIAGSPSGRRDIGRGQGPLIRSRPAHLPGNCSDPSPDGCNWTKDAATVR